MSHDEALERLDRAACLELLRTVPIGRVAWADDYGWVTVLPVNFVLDGDTIIFRTSAGAKLAAVEEQRPLTFQADDVEPALQIGWSVVASGPAMVVTDAGELDSLEGLRLAPWVRDAKPAFVRITARRLTGRRIPLHPGGTSVQSVDEEGSAF